MTTIDKTKIKESVQTFRLPRYEEIPTVGLYLEQVTKYISDYLKPLQENSITRSMVSNYVKQNLIESPVKKQYSRDQIAYLIFIAVAKNVLSLDNLKRFISLQKTTYTVPRAYNYFCEELENILAAVFSLKESAEDIGGDSTDEKEMLRSTIIAVSYKIYLEKSLSMMAEKEEKEEQKEENEQTYLEHVK